MVLKQKQFEHFLRSISSCSAARTHSTGPNSTCDGGNEAKGEEWDNRGEWASHHISLSITHKGGRAHCEHRTRDAFETIMGSKRRNGVSRTSVSRTSNAMLPFFVTPSLPPPLPYKKTSAFFYNKYVVHKSVFFFLVGGLICCF